MLKSTLMTLALVASASTLAVAQDTTIIKKERPAVVVPAPAPPAVVAPPVVERRVPETTGRANCESKTVTHEGVEGSSTVKKERCD